MLSPVHEAAIPATVNHVEVDQSSLRQLHEPFLNYVRFEAINTQWEAVGQNYTRVRVEPTSIISLRREPKE
ncbi:MAG: hypothetical protein KGJ82_11245 [Nitrospirota bacterium]|nr:hypothetical protein [Nitrospirota bacterium]